jgi:hypothetical protein
MLSLGGRRSWALQHRGLWRIQEVTNRLRARQRSIGHRRDLGAHIRAHRDPSAPIGSIRRPRAVSARRLKSLGNHGSVCASGSALTSRRSLVRAQYRPLAGLRLPHEGPQAFTARGAGQVLARDARHHPLDDAHRCGAGALHRDAQLGRRHRVERDVIELVDLRGVAALVAGVDPRAAAPILDHP